MDKDLEERWQAAVKEKQSGRIESGSPHKGMEFLWKVTDPDYVGTAAENWSSRCEASIRKEKIEVEKKYGIRLGRTEVYCFRCGKPWGFGNHSCQDIRLEKLLEKKNEKVSLLEKGENKALEILKGLRAKKAAVYLTISERTVTHWIQRESIPKRYINRVLNL